jgi:hypothetical protein
MSRQPNIILGKYFCTLFSAALSQAKVHYIVIILDPPKLTIAQSHLPDGPSEFAGSDFRLTPGHSS